VGIGCKVWISDLAYLKFEQLEGSIGAREEINDRVSFRSEICEV
jgi:hypothetical protein